MNKCDKLKQLKDSDSSWNTKAFLIIAVKIAWSLQKESFSCLKRLEIRCGIWYE